VQHKGGHCLGYVLLFAAELNDRVGRRVGQKAAYWPALMLMRSEAAVFLSRLGVTNGPDWTDCNV